MPSQVGALSNLGVEGHLKLKYFVYSKPTAITVSTVVKRRNSPRSHGWMDKAKHSLGSQWIIKLWEGRGC